MVITQSIIRHRIVPSDDAKFLTAGQWLYRHLAAGTFPQLIGLGGERRRFRKLADLPAWEEPWS
jgi:hypothetical protein